jgi:hypothetical protein
MVIVQRVVASRGPVCLMSCSSNTGENTEDRNSSSSSSSSSSRAETYRGSTEWCHSRLDCIEAQAVCPRGCAMHAGA